MRFVSSTIACCLAFAFAQSVFALEVVFDERRYEVLRVDKFPEDLSRLALHGMDDQSAAEFKPSTGKKSLTVYRRK